MQQHLTTASNGQGLFAMPTAEQLRDIYGDFAQNIAPFHAAAAELPTDAPTPEQAKTAKEFRLKLVKVRTAIEAARKQAKDNALKFGQAVDAHSKQLQGECSDLEAKFEAVEKHAERISAAEREARMNERYAAISPYQQVPPTSLADLTDGAFALMLDGAKAAHERKEQERIAAEKEAHEKAEFERKERGRIAAEHAAMREALEAKEREEREAQREREALEAKRIAAERAEKEAAERAEKEKREREAAEARAAEQEAQRIAAEKREAEMKAKMEAQRIAAEQEAQRIAAEQKRKAAAFSALSDPTRMAAALAKFAEIAQSNPDSKDVVAAKWALLAVVL